ncbi:xanthine dehydrogenase family protein molybdopterin-binding subunit [Sulfolobus sp. E11-6]|uniref:xanthine dehydrogenase family protein molybdopterin-binding subunit n=1 Tax=Sulfolobus sp. E11-6 TaxID=2663020 RepID=UPI001295DF26|nr:xanthine dehydrogenase family protein molybdopterin-binding subunit [Sulfolobus sp. E11-6]QGA69044.1 molybdopterin-dependent oxidoreductase [Sulfolobus sp. E11-6]
MDEKNFRWIGKPMKTVEDYRFITGKGVYVDDLDFPGEVLHVAILRSPYAHARLLKVNVSNALKIPGVKAVVTGEDAVKYTTPIPAYAVAKFKPEEYVLAVNKVRYVGEPIAAVAAVDRATAEDAIEAIEVEYEPLKPVINPEDAMKPNAPLLYESYGTNVVAHYEARWGEVEKAFKEADLIIKEKLILQRYSSTPLEPVAVVVQYDKNNDKYTFWANVQMPGHAMMVLPQMLKVPTTQVRLIIPDIGGGFGIKTRPWRQLVISALLAKKLPGAYVKYIETRTEHMMAAGISAGLVAYVEVAVKKDGRILGFKLHDINDDGASIQYAGTYASMHATLINGCYDIRNIEWVSDTVLTNTCPSMPNRGVGKPGIVYIIERIIDIVARELGMDPAEIRFKNFIPKDKFPYVNPAGRVYDSGNYAETLRKALEIFEYQKWREYQKEMRSKGRYIGIGICSYIHGASATAREIEGVKVKMDPSGKVFVESGSPDMGTSHATSYTQILADFLGVNPSDVVMLHFDSERNPWTPYSGTHANKFSGPDIEVLVEAAKRLRERLIKLASAKLNVDSDLIELADGKAYHKYEPSKSVSIAELAKMAYQNPGLLPDIEAGLEVTVIGNTKKAMEAFVQNAQYEVGALHQLVTGHGSPTGYLTYPNSVHVAAIEVDADTGQINILKYVIVHDIGKMINPLVVEGQVHGGLFHGVGAALYEEFKYDENGQLLTTSYGDYGKPTAIEIPNVEISHTETPSPRSSLGIKGIGEGETFGPLCALPNAVEDALQPLGIRVRNLPMTREKIYNLIQEALSKAKFNK